MYSTRYTLNWCWNGVGGVLLPSTSPILCTDTCKYSQTHIHKSTHSFYCPPRTLDVKKVPRSLYLSLILSVSRSLCPSVLLSLCVSLCRPVTLFLCLSVCRSADSLSLYLSVSLAHFLSLLLVSVAVSLAFSLNPTHTHVRTHIRTYTYTNTHTGTHTYTRTHRQTYTQHSISYCSPRTSSSAVLAAAGYAFSSALTICISAWVATA